MLITHHVEDIPPTTTHLLALAAGVPVAAGPIDEVLDAGLLRMLFGVPVELQRHEGRWSARSLPADRWG